MSNHSLTAQGTDLPFSHKRGISIAHKQNNYYMQQNTYLWAVICRSRGGLSANEKEGQSTLNDNNNYWVLVSIGVRKRPVQNLKLCTNYLHVSLNQT